MNFGERLRALRKEQQMSQRDLASMVGVDFTYISKMENERLEFPPSIATIQKIAQVLSVSTDELLILAGKRGHRYATVLDIIEAGIAGDAEKCRAYAQLWQEQLQQDGEDRIVQHLCRILEGHNRGQVIHLA
jgi:transcriptional regulator with XRE-family HTH domain